MKKALLGAVAAFGLALTGYAGAAQAQCYWTGYRWVCGDNAPTYPSVSGQPAGHLPWGTYGWDYNYNHPYDPYPGPRPSSNH